MNALPHLSTALFFAIPLIFAGIVHMVVVKLDLLSSLRVPIDERRFGANKTWRGVVVMTSATMSGVLLAGELEPSFALRAPLLVSITEAPSLLLGAMLGLAYVLVYAGATHWPRLAEPASVLRTGGTLLILAGVVLVTVADKRR